MDPTPFEQLTKGVVCPRHPRMANLINARL
jgi:hypothetical protein